MIQRTCKILQLDAVCVLPCPALPCCCRHLVHGCQLLLGSESLQLICSHHQVTFCTVLHRAAPCCTVLHRSCTVLHRSCTVAAPCCTAAQCSHARPYPACTKPAKTSTSIKYTHPPSQPLALYSYTSSPNRAHTTCALLPEVAWCYIFDCLWYICPAEAGQS